MRRRRMWLGGTLASTRAGRDGLDLDRLRDVAETAGLAMRAIRRDPGAALPVPSVVHWRVGHYGAITAVDGDRVLVRDPALGRTRWLRRGVLERQASGYFLVPRRLTDGGRHDVAGAEAAAVRGT